MVRKDVHYSGSEKGSHLAQAHGSGNNVGGWGGQLRSLAGCLSDWFPWTDLSRVTSVPLQSQQDLSHVGRVSAGHCG